MKIKSFVINLAISVTIILGIAGSASANPERSQGVSPEQQDVIGKIYSEYDSKTLPLQQKIIVKQSELDALFYEGSEKNTAKIQSLIKEIGELRAQKYAAQSEMRSRLDEAGVYSSEARKHSGYGMMDRHNSMNSDYRGCGCPW
ncbi:MULTISPECIES: hypothetical protein [Citrobacter]|uniref:hypothetical protein n=1 Tax=Citrobacter TaxID=544 RepID=UPI0015E9FE3C|nr:MULTISPECIES: hypothetical protein [Citrobacter]HCL6053591.1 hypothetical protein [Raoultella ornithinolytica]MBJ9840219.1 hypothetical protein [Citrobacter freundii]MCY3420022.1 hypothetical protein [Citrobacter freundii]MDE8815678.1 hypothetical protein [Citrobacter freundii]MDE8821700.1 hypothetical protein [Citrobacter freundii]